MNTRLFALAISLAFAAAVPLAAADKQPLREARSAGDTARVSAELRASGVEQVLLDEKRGNELKFSAEATLSYEEKTLAPRAGAARRAVRYYDNARVESRVDANRTVLALRDAVRLIVAEQQAGQRFLFSPSGPLTGEEQQLVEAEGMLDSLSAGLLLPAEPVAPGDTWKIDEPTLTALLNVFRVTESQVQGRLESIDDHKADILISGKLDAAVAGTKTKLELDGRLVFDRQRSRIRRIELKQKEDRLPGGPGGPGLRVEATLTLAWDWDKPAAHVNDAEVQRVPLEPNAATAQLMYYNPDTQVRFYFPRGWRIFYSDPQLVALRYVDNNELMAHCNVARGPAVVAGEHMKPEDFRSQVRQALGDHFQKFVQEGEVAGPKGYWIYRLAAAGMADKMPVVWYYYVVAGPQGQQVVFSFTLEARLADKFGPRDLSLVGTVEFATPRTASSSK